MARADHRATDLDARADRLPPSLRRMFRRRVSGASRIEDEAKRQTVFASIAADLSAAERRLQRRREMVPEPISYPEELPITARRDDLVDAIRRHQVVIVAGETGSGKSTQLPKLCLEAGRGVAGLIGHTQPRRIAARSIAERLAEETGTAIGGMVGYTIRFSDQVGEETLVKVMTDGILLGEIHRDPRLARYDTIILDEAHERSLNIDFLIGYIKSILPRREDLKLIVTSATIDTARFSEHFGDAPVIEVTGRSYPVEIRYRPLDDIDRSDSRDQPQAICDAVAELSREGEGDILVFCSGEREIRDAADALGDLSLAHTEILPLYARLSSAEQHRVFEPHRGRRIVLATNVAETSLTVPGVRYVVDPGTARISRYSRRTRVQQLPIEPVSRASADQRAGRCGRLGPGICIRLFSEDDYEARPEFTEPEIQRTNLASVILQMAAADLGDVEDFPFLDPPDTRSIRDGIALLEELGAVDPSRFGTRRWLTAVGRRLAQFPLDPRLARMVVEADRFGCLREVLVIVSALSIQDPRERPRDAREAADVLHARFVDQRSDLLGWLLLWEYLQREQRARSGSQFRKLCRDEYLNYRRIREWQDVHAQLKTLAGDLGYVRNRQPAEADAVHRALLAGLLSQIGSKDPESFEYRAARGARFSIAPGSTLFKRPPKWVMAAELVETQRLWARGLAPVDPLWIEHAGAHLIRRSYGDPWWDAERGTAVAGETVTLFGLPLVTGRVVTFERVDPVVARDLFIRHALVAGEWRTRHRFAVHNRAVFDEVAALEERSRRLDLLADDDAIAAFFDRRLPDDVTSSRRFDAWWKSQRVASPGLLDLTLDDVIDRHVQRPDADAFPETWEHGDIVMPIRYEFDPSSPTDGLTVDIPLAGIERVDPGVFDWLVPGLREELLIELVKSLPKRLRKAFVPVPDTVRSLLSGHRPTDGALVPYLRKELSSIAGEPIPVDAFDLGRLPAYLRPRFRVVDAAGLPVAVGEDLGELKATLHEMARAAVADAVHEVEQSGLTRWSFGALPPVIQIGEPAKAVDAYPALVDEGDSVSIRLLGTRAEQAESMWRGTRRLLVLNLPSMGRLLRSILDRADEQAMRAGPYESTTAWVDDCVGCALDGVLDEYGGPPWDAVGFDALLEAARRQLADRVEEVARSSLQILNRHRTVQRVLGEAPDTYEIAVADARSQVARLVYPGFLGSVGQHRLADVARYLEAILVRFERMADRPGRDLEAMVLVRSLEREHAAMAAMLLDSAALTEIAWMLEELRVSLFAQQLGTAVPVSEKRIRRALAAAAIP